jgi:hypothetical protein
MQDGISRFEAREFTPKFLPRQAQRFQLLVGEFQRARKEDLRTGFRS